MRRHYRVFSRKSSEEISEVVAACRGALARHHEERGETLDSTGDIVVGGMIPESEEALSMIWEEPGERANPGAHKVVPILAELTRVVSVLSLTGPDDWTIDPLHAAVFRWLVEQAGPGLVQLGDALELSGVVLEELRGFPPFPGLEGAEPAVVSPASSNPGEPEVETQLRLLEALIQRWEERSRVELHPNVDRSLLAEALLVFLSDRRPPASLVGWLLEAEDVAEVFASEADLASDLAELLGRGQAVERNV